MNILFICSQGEDRSPTAKEIWKELYPDDETESLGIYNCQKPKKLLNWADRIFVFENQHEDELQKLDMKYWGKSINLNIPSTYYYKQSSLVKLLKKKFKEF